jgi:ABC-type dipeptide/oligopeptide/nickel transport system permease component
MNILRKIALGLLTLWGVSVVIFLLLFWVPKLGTDKKDPTDAIALAFAGPRAGDANLENIKRDLGLKEPLYIQYGIFVQQSLTNNLKSIRNGDYVFSAIWRRFPATAVLALTAIAVYLILAIPIALWTAPNAGKPIDNLVLILCILGISIPTFWLARLLQHYLGYEAGLFSVGGGANLANLPLPALTLGIGGAAFYARLLHANLRGVMKQDYIRAARARGLNETQVMSKHALKNALIPAIAVLGMEFASLLSGLIFTEKIFGWPGIGSLAIDSVQNGDVPMIMGTVLFSALMVVIANILVDVVYRLVDPRVRI